MRLGVARLKDKLADQHGRIREVGICLSTRRSSRVLGVLDELPVPLLQAVKAPARAVA